jgi:hypothetical protein
VEEEVRRMKLFIIEKSRRLKNCCFIHFQMYLPVVHMASNVIYHCLEEQTGFHMIYAHVDSLII